jgi:hypothetical protein
LLEVRSEQVSLALCEISDWLEFADSVSDKELMAPGRAPLPLACEQLGQRPSTRLYRTIEDDLGGGQVSGAYSLLELRSRAPDLVRPL